MPSDEGKVRDQCVAATKMTRIFRDLLASGGSVNSQFEEVNELSKQEAELDYL